MITSLKLKNFQCYKKAKVVFDKGVNIIIGKSDSGKSSIIRSIRLLLQNKPSGENFRKHKTDLTKVTGVFDKDTVTRERGKNKNQYKLNDEVFKAMGSNVPDSIVNRLNIGDENIQSQHEFYFLLDKPSGQVAKSLNEVSDLSIMDTAMQKVKADLKETSGLVTNMDGTILNIQKMLKESEWVEFAETDLRELLQFDISIKKAHDEYYRLNRMIEDALEAELDLSKLLPPNASKDFDEVALIYEMKLDIETNKITLSKLLAKLEETTNKLDACPRLEDDRSFADIQKWSSDKEKLSIQIESTKYLLNKINNQLETIKVLDAIAIALEDEIDKIPNCPYCGSEK